MLLKLILAIIVLNLIVTLFVLHRVVGLKPLLIYELSVLEDFMKTRINTFLDVFRKSKNKMNNLPLLTAIEIVLLLIVVAILICVNETLKGLNRSVQRVEMHVECNDNRDAIMRIQWLFKEKFQKIKKFLKSKK